MMAENIKKPWLRCFYCGANIILDEVHIVNDPLEPIREVWEKYKHISFPDNSDAYELIQAIKKAMGEK